MEHRNNRIAFFSYVIIMLFFVISCSDDMGHQSEKSNSQLSHNHSGSAVFSIIWPERSVDEIEDGAQYCADLGIVNVTVDVYEAEQRIVEASFDCSDREGVINNIPPGKNRRFVISGKDSGWNSIYRGERSGVEIILNSLTDIGFIELLPIWGKDTVAPRIISTVPLVQALNVDLNTVVSVTFSEAVDENTLTPDTFRINDGFANITGNINSMGHTVSFQPARALDYDRLYIVILTQGICDLSGNPLAEPFTWTFRTLENIPPIVNDIFPEDGASGVRVYTHITAIFSEPIDPDTINSETFLVQSDSLNSDVFTIEGHVTYDESTRKATFLPFEDLPYDTIINITMTTGIMDIAGNQMAIEKKGRFITASTRGEQIGTNLHTISLKADGTLWAWGNNEDGQLGDATNESKNVPIQINDDTNWATLATGYDFSLALKNDGTLWAWGGNTWGQLGDGATIDKSFPVQIGNDSDWLSVSAGDMHALALKTDHTLWSWGNYYRCQLGYVPNPSVSTYVPNQVGTDNDWVFIAAGVGHSLAIKSNGTLWGWGNDLGFEIEYPTTEDRYLPVQIGTDTDWIAVAAGIGLKNNGTLWAWGDNSYGQLGDGTFENKYVPVQIGTDTNWKTIAKGAHVLALKDDGTLWSWGYNSFGQVGDGTTVHRNIPTQIGRDTNWNAIFAGSDHSMAIKNDGTLWVWGNNEYGQLGDGTNENKHVPTLLEGFETCSDR